MTCYRLEIRGKSVTAPVQYRRVKSNALLLAEHIAGDLRTVKVFELPLDEQAKGGTLIATYTDEPADPLADLDL